MLPTTGQALCWAMAHVDAPRVGQQPVHPAPGPMGPICSPFQRATHTLPSPCALSLTLHLPFPAFGRASPRFFSSCSAWGWGEDGGSLAPEHPVAPLTAADWAQVSPCPSGSDFRGRGLVYFDKIYITSNLPSLPFFKCVVQWH